MAESFVLASASALAELLTMTAVIGKPPRIPLKKLPVPCAINSLFCGVMRLYRSILSMASTLSNVSRVATIQMTTAFFIISVFVKIER